MKAGTTLLLAACLTTSVNAATQEGRLPVTTDGLYNAVELTEISQRANHQAERIANVMTAIGFVQNRKAVGNGNKQRGWWPSDQPDQPKRRF